MLDSLSSAALAESRALELQNPFTSLPDADGFEAWFALVEANFRALAVAECRAILQRYLGEDSGDLGRFRECNAIYCYDARIERAVSEHLPRLSGLLKRRAELFLGHLLQFRVAGEEHVAALTGPLETAFFQYRGLVSGEERTFGQLNHLIKSAPDRAVRQAAWEAFVPLGAANRDGTLALVTERNALARSLGHRDYMAMRLKQSELDERWLLDLLDRLEAETEAPYRAACEALSANLGVEQPGPWDLFYAIEKLSPLPPETFDRASATERLRKLLAGWGFSDAEMDLPLHFAESFTMGGMCFGIEPGREVAILLSPTNGPRFYRTFFHEYGHAMHFRHAAQGSLLLNEEDAAFNEGMAVFFEAMVADPEWIRENLELNEADVERFCCQARYAALNWMRTLLVNIRFEHALYTRPEQDPDAYYLELLRRCGHFEVGPEAGPRWAADQLLVSLPVYWHTYLLGEVIARQAHEAIRARDGALLGNPNVRGFLMEHFYEPGSSLPWPEKIRRATGRTLDGDAFFRYLQQA